MEINLESILKQTTQTIEYNHLPSLMMELALIVKEKLQNVKMKKVIIILMAKIILFILIIENGEMI